MEDMYRARDGEGTQSFHSLYMPLCLHLHTLTNPEAVPSPPLNRLGFYSSFITQAGQNEPLALGD